MLCVRFDAKFVLLAIVLAGYVYFSEAESTTIPFLIELLQKNPTLIRMRMLKIQGQQPNPMCSIDISSTSELMEQSFSSSVCIKKFYELKFRLRQMSCQFFMIREAYVGDGTIFTHDAFSELKHDDCKPSALYNIHVSAKRTPCDIPIAPKDVSALFDLNNEPNSKWWMEKPSSTAVLKTIPMLTKLLHTYPTLIRMRMLKIQGQQPNPMCSIDISSTTDLVKSLSSPLGYNISIAGLKRRLRDLSCQFFTFRATCQVDGMIFTHDVFRELKHDDCNPSALCNMHGSVNYRPFDIPITPNDVSALLDLNNETNSQWWMAAVSKPKTIPFLVDLLQKYPTLIRMRMLKIQGQQPNPVCSIDISSTAELMKKGLSGSVYFRRFSDLKLNLRNSNWQFFSFPETRGHGIGTIFTHAILRELNSDECNPSALYNMRLHRGPKRKLSDIPIAPTDVSELVDMNNEPISQWWMEEPISRKRLRMS